MKRPVIGITTDGNERETAYASRFEYATAVEKAGGLPLLLPYRTDLSLMTQIVDLLNGICFSGGNDLDPSAYGEPWHPKAVPVDPMREKFERALLVEVEKRRLPTLGICMGSQLMNIHRGGSMVQFLPDQQRQPNLEHRKLGEVPPRHDVNLARDSTLARLLGKIEVHANSSHKQAVKKVGLGLRIIATAPDGVIEGIEDPTFPLFLGVQWHPERLHDELDHLAIFRLLVERSTPEH